MGGGSREWGQRQIEGMYFTLPMVGETTTPLTSRVSKKWERRVHADQGANLHLRTEQNALFLWRCPAGLGKSWRETNTVTDARLKLQDWKTGQKSLECPGALTKQETESGKKKIREKCSVMQFHPQGKVGKYHTILPQKMLVKIVTGSNIMTMKKARKCHINDFRWVFLFYSFLSNEDCAPKSTQKPLLPCKTDILKMLEGEMFGEPRQQHGFPIENNGYTVSFLRKRNLGSETISA